MKKTNLLKKIITYCAIGGIFFGTFLYYFPVTSVFSELSDPQIEFTTPIDGETFHTDTITFTGMITPSGIPLDDYQLKIMKVIVESESEQELESGLEPESEQGPESGLEPETEQGSGLESAPVPELDPGLGLELASISESTKNDITDKGTLHFDKKTREWSFEATFEEGDHKLSFIIENSSSEVVHKSTVEFVVDLTQEEHVEETPPVSRPVISEIQIIPGNGIVDDMTNVPLHATFMLVVKDSEEITYAKPFIMTTSDGKQVISEEELDTPTLRTEEMDEFTYHYIPFTPKDGLQPGTTYYVHVNHELANEVGGTVFPRFFQFTTESTLDFHGNFTTNTNACAYCHSTHEGKNESLIGGEYGKLNGDAMCMTCHDGTNGSPTISHTNGHSKLASSSKSGNSCTSCHNPHLEWDSDNPNKLKDYFEYQHSSNVGQINSKETLCETCHGPDDPKREQVFSANNYKVYSYKKMNATGWSSDDFSLCFSCHDGTDGVNIKKYYTKESYLSASGHNISALDGSNLNGAMPCADCHGTHGSDNLFMLKGKLGFNFIKNNNFESVGERWTSANERNFCMTCHNNSIEMYGKTATFDKIIEGHQSDNEQSCSTCHGSGDNEVEQFRSAAHAPLKRGFVILPEEEEEEEDTEDPSE